jgi:hypothetical protein
MGVFGDDFWDFNARLDSGAPHNQHVLYTVNGAGVSMWDGYQADIARALGNQYWAWQPIGYNANPFPMKPGLDSATKEFERQLIDVHPTGTFGVLAYSEGAIIAANVYDKLRNPTSSIAHRHQDFIGAATFGNPRRQKGHTFPGCPDPGGEGIVAPTQVGVEDSWWDFANHGDLYTTMDGATGAEAADMRAIWNFVYNIWNGVGSLALQIFKLIGNPLLSIAAIEAMIAAMGFFGGGLRQHVDYHLTTPLPGNGLTCWQLAFNHLQDIGVTVPVRI